MSNGASFIKSEIVEGHKVYFTFLGKKAPTVRLEMNCPWLYFSLR